MISALNRLNNGTIELTITIPKEHVLQSYQKTLQKLATNVQIKGFRKGKAPINLAEKELGKSKIYEEVLKTLIPEVYLTSVKEHNLKPIINPRITIITLEEDKDWQIKATTCELPSIDLGDYQRAVRKALAADKIWVPGQDKTRPSKDENLRLEKIFQTLLDVARSPIPEILIQDEMDRMLSRLIDQTAKLEITVEQYLASSGKTKDQLRSEYRQEAEKSLKLEFILGAIAEKEKIEIPDSQVGADDPAQRAYIRQLLRKRQVIDNLSKL